MADTATLTGIANVIIPAADQRRMLQFYTGVLGLEKRLDAEFGDGQRWIEVAPRGSHTVIAIAPPGPGVIPGGKDTGISFHALDVDAFHRQLQSHGTDVDARVTRLGDAVPPLFWFRDPEGNTLMVVQAPGDRRGGHP